MNFQAIKNSIPLNWKDILWGYDHHLLGWQDVVNYAHDDVTRGSSDTYVFELSVLDKANLINLDDLLKNIAGSIEHYDNEKWLYLVLLDLFNSRDELDDPLGEVEKIYADFDYPEEIESFVRYMPPPSNYDPAKHTYEENMNRLYSNWEKYLNNKQAILLLKSK